MSKTFYLTTPLYYVNGEPHVGHVYTTVIADTIARYKRLCGLEVCSLTGTDEHGLKIERAARAQNMTPQELSDKYAGTFKAAWERLDLSFDEFIRTTQERHTLAVHQIFKQIQKNGFIYPGEYSGNYCVNCEAYTPEGETVCPDCGRQTEYVTEESFFFKLSAFEEKLLAFYSDNPDFVLPHTRMNEVISFVKGGLKDLSISRTSFSWGIPIPDEPRHIFY
ncbi:MAG TPA: class I tRNA ligase family protein, partial [Acidobacteriota bacterium]|nr:class I tRNA ligase family protein [Acidobacteriota bacterium]